MSDDNEEGNRTERARVGRKLRSAEEIASKMSPTRRELVQAVHRLVTAQFGEVAVWSKVRAAALERREELKAEGITISPSLEARGSKYLSNQFGPRRNRRLKIDHPVWNTVWMVVHLSTPPERRKAELEQVAWLWQQDHDGRRPLDYQGELVPPPSHSGSGDMPAELLEQLKPYWKQLETAEEPEAAELKAAIAYREELLARGIAQARALPTAEDQGVQPVLEEILSKAGLRRAARLDPGAGVAERLLATYLSVLADLRQVPVSHLAQHIGVPEGTVDQMLIAQWLPNQTQAGRLAKLVRGKPEVATAFCRAAERDRASMEAPSRTPGAELLELRQLDAAADNADNVAGTSADNASLQHAVPDLRPRTRTMLSQVAWLAGGSGCVTAGGWLVHMVAEDHGQVLNVGLLIAIAGLLALCGVSFYRAFRPAT